ncbi:MAG: tetratricopeptide repeat protein [Candidatus Thermoplasmatota archaeon]|nr:tetratricopeptide repeat protein [Candidatus Thermoplasmatota archaeon]MBS3790133.1 tetratricopeptide repeat protein [Candidatus Thermoplasmatota archaeon]
MADVEALLEEAETQLNRFEYEEAYEKFSELLEEDCEENVEAQAHFGRAEASLGLNEIDSEEILEDYERAIELNDNPFYRQSAGGFCIDIGKFEKAEEHYRKAAELDPDNKHHYLSDLAVGYRFKAPIMMEEYVEQVGEDIILRKSLNYMLEALEIDQEQAVELLS